MKTDSCRIIAGRWRGRKLRFRDAEGLRPSTDRVRETLFNWLQAVVPGSTCLDLFAGSGALGFEALSRGATHCLLIDNNPQTVAMLRQNADTLQAEHADIRQADALAWLAAARASSRFDLVFLDPPFAAGLLDKAAAALEHSGLLQDDALIYLEHKAKDEPAVPPNWQPQRQKKAGQVVYRLYRRSAPE